jgi:hypothetical protein
VANLIAAAAMGYYLWTHHPKLAAALREVDLEGAGVAQPSPREGGERPAVSPRGEGSSGGGSGTP